MKKSQYHCIGVMSGTSLDGIDLAHIIFNINDNIWSYEILECETISYTDNWIDKLKNAVSFSKEELAILNQNYTQLLGKTIQEFIANYQIENLDSVCSHGHTILHHPHNGFTLQIGNLPEIVSYCQQKIVCDFRVQDVQLGGQGAPLVPIGDRILFSDFDFCLNLGGFSNVSFESKNQRIAFDISPVNTVLNFYANQLGFEYDDKGKISQSGNFNPDLFRELNTLEYYQTSFPKSLGFEFVKETVLPLVEKFAIATEDKMRTFTEHIAFQTAQALQVFDTQNKSLLITGGGAYNDFLIDKIRFYLPEMSIIIPDRKTLEYKEALIFALLGVLRLRNEINVLSSVTGAKHDHCGGIIFL